MKRARNICGCQGARTYDQAMKTDKVLALLKKNAVQLAKIRKELKRFRADLKRSLIEKRRVGKP
jgi:hypothetical protein